jgi:hypothetical protein
MNGHAGLAEDTHQNHAPCGHPMTVSGAAAAASNAASQQAQSLTAHKRRHSISDVPMQGTSAASALSPTGKTGRTLDITA